LRLEERGQRSQQPAQRDCASLRAKFFRLLENADNIWVFEAFDFCAIAENEASARDACDHEIRRNDALSIPTKLVQKIFCQEARKRALSHRIRHESSESARKVIR
jgi:hypothetical protein